MAAQPTYQVIGLSRDNLYVAVATGLTLVAGMSLKGATVAGQVYKRVLLAVEIPDRNPVSTALESLPVV